MTSVEMRKNILFSRNSFPTVGKWQIPIVERQRIELDNVELIAYSDIRTKDNALNRKKRGTLFY